MNIYLSTSPAHLNLEQDGDGPHTATETICECSVSQTHLDTGDRMETVGWACTGEGHVTRTLQTPALSWI